MTGRVHRQQNLLFHFKLTPIKIGGMSPQHVAYNRAMSTHTLQTHTYTPSQTNERTVQMLGVKFTCGKSLKVMNDINMNSSQIHATKGENIPGTDGQHRHNVR